MSESVFSPQLLAQALEKIKAHQKQRAEEFVTRLGYDINTTVGVRMVECYIGGFEEAQRLGYEFFNKH